MADKESQNIAQFGNGHIIDNRFEIISNPVKRSSGIAYLAYDQQLDLKKTLVFAPDTINQNPKAISAIREQEAFIRWLSHPHIAKLYGFHSAGSVGYFECEYIKGRNLRQQKLSASQNKLQEAEVKSVGLQILGALAYAHNNNVIHGRLNIQNVMLTDEGNIKLLDFGLAGLLDNSGNLSNIALSIMSLLYISPEQLAGGRVTISSDIYSLGAILYELLSGNPPFNNGNIAKSIREEVPKPITNISAEFNTLIFKALAKDPQDRFTDCGEFNRELEKIEVPPIQQDEQEKVEVKTPLQTRAPEKKKDERSRMPFKFFSLNPTLKYMSASLVVILLASFVISKLPHIFKIREEAQKQSLAVQDTFKLKLALALKNEADLKFDMSHFVTPTGNNALELYRKSLEANPSDTIVKNRISEIRQMFINDAEQAMVDKRYSQALSILREGIDKFPDDSILYQIKSSSAFSEFTKIRLSILNGAGEKGIAHKLAASLQSQGYTIVYIENFRIDGKLAWNQPRSTLSGMLPKDEKINNLADFLGVDYEMDVTYSHENGNITLILGKDYRTPPAF